MVLRLIGRGRYKLEEYSAALTRDGMLLADVPFVVEQELEGVISKPFHRKRFLRCGKSLPVVERQTDKYGAEWQRQIASRFVLDNAGSPRGGGGKDSGFLKLMGDPQFMRVDRQFEGNIAAYRRIRQLVDPEYAMSTQARTRCQGRLAPGGWEVERQRAR